LDYDAHHCLEVGEGDLLDPLVDRRAGISKHRDPEAELARVDRGLGDAALDRGAREEEPLDLQRAQDQA
jgi:hypothetical protein